MQGIAPPGSGRTIQLNIQNGNSSSTLKLFLDAQEFTQQLMLSSFAVGRMYEPETVSLFARFLRPGDRMIDVGAHIGYYSLIAALLVGEQGKVLACELEFSNYQRILYNIAINGFTQLQAVNLAIGSAEKEVQFFFNQDNDGGHALWDVGAHPFNVKSQQHPMMRTVPMQTLDHLVEQYQLDHLRLIKIDTEGAEHQILQGCQKTLQRLQPPFVIAEVNEFGLRKMGSTQMQLRSLMQSYGYTGYLLDEKTMEPVRLDSATPYQNGLFNILFTNQSSF